MLVNGEGIDRALEILDEEIGTLAVIFGDPVKERIQRRRLRSSAAA